MFNRSDRGLISGGKFEPLFHRRVEATRAGPVEVGAELGDEVGGVEGLGQVQGPCSAVARDGGVQDPLELALVLGREALRDVGNEAGA